MVTTRLLLVPLLDAGQGCKGALGKRRDGSLTFLLRKLRHMQSRCWLSRLPAPPSPLEEQLSVSESAILIPVGEMEGVAGAAVVGLTSQDGSGHCFLDLAGGADWRVAQTAF